MDIFIPSIFSVNGVSLSFTLRHVVFSHVSSHQEVDTHVTLINITQTTDRPLFYGAVIFILLICNTYLIFLAIRWSGCLLPTQLCPLASRYEGPTNQNWLFPDRLKKKKGKGSNITKTVLKPVIPTVLLALSLTFPVSFLHLPHYMPCVK